MILTYCIWTPKVLAKSPDSSPDEARTFEKGKIEITKFADRGVTINRSTFEPGRRLEKCVKPLVKTISLQAHHPLHVLRKNKGIEGGWYNN